MLDCKEPEHVLVGRECIEGCLGVFERVEVSLHLLADWVSPQRLGQDIVSWLAGSNDVDGPVPTASDVVVATGEAGVPWRIVATPSDQGLCLFTVIAVSGEKGGSGNCGYTDIRGDLPRDLRGDPSAKCLATPTTVVPCGSLPRHWMSAPGGGGLQAGLERKFTYGLLAEEVASVELVLTDGESVRAHVLERPDGLPFDDPGARRAVVLVGGDAHRGRLLLSRGDAAVALRAEAGDLAVHDVARLQEAAVVHAVAGGRAGEQQVA